MSVPDIAQHVRRRIAISVPEIAYCIRRQVAERIRDVSTAHTQLSTGHRIGHPQADSGGTAGARAAWLQGPLPVLVPPYAISVPHIA
eukprot:1144038-Rhodomonas_salina.1